MECLDSGAEWQGLVASQSDAPVPSIHEPLVVRRAWACKFSGQMADVADNVGNRLGAE